MPGQPGSTAPEAGAAGRGLRLVLASASPQRSAALARLGVPFEIQPSEAAELEHGVPEEVAVENALRKARAVATARGGGVGEAVLGVDTLVTLDGVIYGKPADTAQARATLSALSGSTRRVLSGVALLLDGEERTALAATEVRFRELDEPLLEWYVAQEEWRERSGGYAIQKGGSLLVTEVRGDYENVVGLPLATLLDLWPALLPRLG
jgi:septum formation protein